MAPDATDEDIAAVVARVEEVGGELRKMMPWIDTEF